MADYFHSALKGDQIHESKIKVLPANSAFPVAEWEGQMLVIGLKFYCSIKQNNVLNWIQPSSYYTPQLPQGVVKFEQGLENPPNPRSGSGVIYTNYTNKNIWYLNNGNWTKLGPDISGLDIIASSFYTHPIPTNGEINAALIKQCLPNKRYYFRIKSPPVASFGGISNNFFFEIYGVTSIAFQEGIVQLEMDTSLPAFQYNYEKIIRIYFNSSSGRIYCNFLYDHDARNFEVKSIAQENWGSS